MTKHGPDEECPQCAECPCCADTVDCADMRLVFTDGLVLGECATCDGSGVYCPNYEPAEAL